jgi:hypothetical protein
MVFSGLGGGLEMAYDLPINAALGDLVQYESAHRGKEHG